MAESIRSDVATPQIFISHARVDARLASQVERLLTTWGLTPWVDRQQLAGGQEWPLMLQQAIDRSAALILVVTPAALSSPMVRREYLHALNRSIPVVLLHFQPVAHLPAELVGAPAVLFRGKGLVIGTALFTLFEDMHLLPQRQEDTLSVMDASDIYHAFANRIPTDWQVFRLPKSVSRRFAFLFFTILLAIFLAGNILPAIITATPGANTFWPIYIAISVIGFLWLFLMAINVGIHLSMLRGNFPSDTIILAPRHCTVQIFTFIQRQVTSMPIRYEFDYVHSAELQTDRRGRAVVVLTDISGGPPARIIIPRRWKNRASIARQIVSMARAYRQAHPRLASTSTPVAPPVEHITAAVAVPTYCWLADASRQKLVQELHGWLAGRGCRPVETITQPGSGGLTLPTAAGAARCNFALVLVSPDVMQSQQSQAIITDLRRQGTLVIPIRASKATALPEQFAGLQWVDFGPGIERFHSFLDLCDTLDRAITLPSLPDGNFDAELVLARAIHQRPSAGEQAFLPNSSINRLYRFSQILGIILCIIPPFLLLTVALSLFLQSQRAYGPEDVFFATLTSFTSIQSIIIFAVFSLWPLVQYKSLLAQFGFLGRLIRGSAAPECMVITPTGIAYHTVDVKQDHFITGGYAFAAIQQISLRIGVLGVRKLRLMLKQGTIAIVPLMHFGTATDQIVEQAQAAFIAAQHWRSVP